MSAHRLTKRYGSLGCYQATVFSYHLPEDLEMQVLEVESVAFCMAGMRSVMAQECFLDPDGKILGGSSILLC